MADYGWNSRIIISSLRIHSSVVFQWIREEGERGTHHDSTGSVFKAYWMCISSWERQSTILTIFKVWNYEGKDRRKDHSNIYLKMKKIHVWEWKTCLCIPKHVFFTYLLLKNYIFRSISVLRCLHLDTHEYRYFFMDGYAIKLKIKSNVPQVVHIWCKTPKSKHIEI